MQGSFGGVFLSHGPLFFLYAFVHLFFSLLFTVCFHAVSFLFLHIFILPTVLLAKTLAQLYGIIFTLGYIACWFKLLRAVVSNMVVMGHT